MDDRQPFLDKSNPDVWKALNGVSLAVRHATEGAGIAADELELLNVRVSQINGCSYCLDLHTKRALAAGVTPLKLAQLPAWPDSRVFTERESALLGLAESVTTLPDQEDRLTAQTIARGVLGEAAFTAAEWAAIAINAYNRVSILSAHPVRLPDGQSRD